MVRDLVKLMRPGDWTKNVFLLPALVFSLGDRSVAHHWDEIRADLVATAIAFLAFSLIASAVYAANDVIDAPKDRTHPVKRKRPVASGAVTPGSALALAAVLLVTGLVLSAFIGKLLVLTMLAYIGLQVAYNLGIKRVIVVDVVALASGFALRATAGGVAIEQDISAWLLLCVFFLCLYLGLIKRLCDLRSAAAAGDSTWRSPAGYDDRIELNWLLGVSATLAVVTYVMYALSEHAWALFQHRAVGIAMLSPLALIAIHRFYRQANEGLSDNPLGVFRADRVLLWTIVLFSAGVIVVLYVPAAEHVLRRIFVASAEG